MLKQIIPSEFCLKCDVCCRFPEKNSCYAPVFPSDGRILLKPHKDIFICPHFIDDSNSCSIYNKRPFDCQLYPFTLTYDKEYENIILCLDTKCPYIQNIKNLAKSHPYIKYLIEAINKIDLPHSLIMPYQEDSIELVNIKNLAGFVALSLEHKNIFDEYLADSEYSARSFASIYIWSDLFNILWKIIDDNLCVFYKYKMEFNMVMPPISPNSREGLPNKKAVLECVKLLKPNGQIENIAAEETKILKDYGVKIHKNTDEYIYLTKNLAELKGNKFASHRAAINQFTKKHKYIYRPFDIMDIDECLNLYINWAKQRKEKNKDAVYAQLLEDSFLAHKKAMMNYKELNLIGKIVEIDKKIHAYTFAFKLEKETYCIMLEVADLEFKGLAQFTYQRFCCDLSDAKYINSMDDSGLENLRKVKLSYHPHKIISNYIGIIL